MCFPEGGDGHRSTQATGRAVFADSVRKVDPQLFYFTTTGACDRFFSSRLVLKHCYDTEALTEELRDRYREHCIDFIMAGILAHN